MSRNVKIALTFLGDCVIFYGSLWLVLVVRYGGRLDTDLLWRHASAFSWVLLIWLLVFYTAGLYDPRPAVSKPKLFNTVAEVTAIAGLLAAAFFYVTSSLFFGIKPLTILALHVGSFALLFAGWRYLIYFTLSQGLASRVLFVGGGELAVETMRELEKRPALGVRPVDLITAAETNVDFKSICLQKDVSTLVIGPDALSHAETVAKLYQCLPLQVKFIDLPSFYEQIMGKIPISAIGQAWFLEKISLHRRGLYDTLKRVFDIVASLILGVLTLVITPLVALAIKLDSPGPVFYRNDRTGKDGKVFYIYKFRTMVKDAEKNGQAVWSQKGDARVTNIGQFLRKTRIDELPQLWNILTGDMSIVGPRPERPEFVAKLTQDIPFYGERHLVKPGLSGWAQISMPYDASADYSREKLQYDLYYIKNRNILLDVGILLKTAKAVLTRSGR